VDVQLLLSDHDVNTLPPAHVGGFLDQVVTHPSRDRENGDRLLNEVLLPADGSTCG
jgi:hypothetical protein